MSDTDGTDLTSTIAAKSDQLNADDLIGGSITVSIAGVRGVAGDQPIAVDIVGHKPYMPCKSMRRVMVALWGADGKTYEGRRFTLFSDPAVTWGGMAVGGIRISHMSHIEKATTIVLAASKKTKKPFTVQPLTDAAPKAANEWDTFFYSAGITMAQFKEYMDSIGMPSLRDLDVDARNEILANPQKYGAAVRAFGGVE